MVSSSIKVRRTPTVLYSASASMGSMTSKAESTIANNDLSPPSSKFGEYCDIMPNWMQQDLLAFFPEANPYVKLGPSALQVAQHDLAAYFLFLALAGLCFVASLIILFVGLNTLAHKINNSWLKKFTSATNAMIAVNKVTLIYAFYQICNLIYTIYKNPVSEKCGKMYDIALSNGSINSPSVGLLDLFAVPILQGISCVVFLMFIIFYSKSSRMMYKESNMLKKMILVFLPLWSLMFGLSQLIGVFFSIVFLDMKCEYYFWLFTQYNVLVKILMIYSVSQLISWSLVIFIENTRPYLTMYMGSKWFSMIYHINYSVFIGSFFIVVQSVLFLYMNPISGNIGMYCDLCVLKLLRTNSIPYLTSFYPLLKSNRYRFNLLNINKNIKASWSLYSYYSRFWYG